jgi:hypothetical protein
MDKVRSRRDVLGAAIGGAAALAAASVIRPLSMRAASTAVMTEVDNPTGSETSITNSASGETTALRGTVTDIGIGLTGETQTGAGVLGTSEGGSLGVAGFSGDPNGYPGVTGIGAGVYGFYGPPASDPSAVNPGVLGDGNLAGVWGAGPIGVAGVGAPAIVGFGDGLGPPGQFGTAVYGFAGATPPEPPNNVGVWAGADAGGFALQVNGRAKFSRSGRTAVSAGKSSKIVLLSGLTSSNLVIATLQTHRTGVYIAAAVPTTGRFTLYLNKAVTATTYFAWFVLN